MKPIIKYVGGKRNEIKLFEKYFPIEYDRYVEPFFGGGATYFYIEPKKALINDKNEKLMQFYKDVGMRRGELIKELNTMKNEEEFYYSVRDMLNCKKEKTYSDSALYAYINRTAYSGMIRHNSKGEFNVPFGRYKTFKIGEFITEEASTLLKTAVIKSVDFEELFEELGSADFVFLDPPYDGTFSKYTMEGFDKEDHERLAQCFKKTKAKCLMVVSDVGNARTLYKDYLVDEYSKVYSFNVKNRMSKDTNISHLIICNY